MKNNIKYIIIGLMVLGILSQASSATVSDGIIYRFSPGDNNSYMINSYLSQGNSSITQTVTLADGSQGNVTIKAGEVVYVEVCNVTTAPDGSQTLFLKGNVDGKNLACDPYFFVFFAYATANNVTYYQNMVAQNSSMYQLNGDIFTTSVTSIQSANEIDYSSYAYNITNGWLQHLTIKITVNNTLTTALDVSLYSPGGSSSSVSYQSKSGQSGNTISTTPGFELLSTMAILTTSAIATTKFKKRKT